EFVTRKISSQLAEVVKGVRGHIELGNFSSVRDWGYAPDYVEAMLMIAEDGARDDYVVATNTICTVRDFLKIVAEELGFSPEFEGEGESERCIDRKTNRVIAKVSAKYYRPSDVTFLRGKHDKISTELGWKPTVLFEDLAGIMARSDIDLLSSDNRGMNNF
ncbi:MAG: GDP-mannose 4,6-dehydratase, partial [Pseudomonadota bacterium]|nr:GDP-mannose 4,6-dehydratase [Pseudomonadota bacterium]